jgi:hypothetical protein
MLLFVDAVYDVGADTHNPELSAPFPGAGLSHLSAPENLRSNHSEGIPR